MAGLAGRALEQPSKQGDTFALCKSLSFAGLPHAIVFAAVFDLLRDEGAEYAQLMEKQGVEVRHIHQPAVPHEHITMTPICSEANDNIAVMSQEVVTLLASK